MKHKTKKPRNEIRKNRIVNHYKTFTLEDFIYLYYQFNLEDITRDLTVEETIKRTDDFRDFIKNANIQNKTHRSFLNYCFDLKRFIEKNNNPQYYQFIVDWTTKYEEEWTLALQKQEQIEQEINRLQTKLVGLDVRRSKYIELKKSSEKEIERLKKTRKRVHKEHGEGIKNLIDESIDFTKKFVVESDRTLQEISHMKKDLQQEVYSKKEISSLYREQMSILYNRLCQFKERLYALEHIDIIEAISGNVEPLEFDYLSHDLFDNGCAVLVSDCSHQVVPYKNPYRKDDFDSRYKNMLGEDIREIFDHSKKVKQYKLIREEDYNDKH